MKDDDKIFNKLFNENDQITENENYDDNNELFNEDDQLQNMRMIMIK